MPIGCEKWARCDPWHRRFSTGTQRNQRPTQEAQKGNSLPQWFLWNLFTSNTSRFPAFSKSVDYQMHQKLKFFCKSFSWNFAENPLLWMKSQASIMTVSQESCCDDYIEQLIPTSSPIGKIKLKIFGHSGTGKTALIESLKAGYFSGLFRRSKKSSSSFQNNSSRYPH